MTVIGIFGPTASGKSRVAETVAAAVGGELVSADAMQVYRGLPILTNQSPALLVGGWFFWSGDSDSRGAPLTQKVAVGDIEDTVSAVGTLQPRLQGSPNEQARMAAITRTNSDGLQQCFERGRVIGWCDVGDPARGLGDFSDCRR